MSHRSQPAPLRKNRSFIQADKNNVELAAAGRHVGRDSLTQHILLNDHPIELYVRVLLLELRRKLFKLNHIRVIDRCDGHSFLLGQDADASKEKKKKVTP